MIGDVPTGHSPSPASSDIVLEIALKAVTKNFNEFLSKCVDENGKPKQPSMKDLMQARACMPKGYSMTLVK